MGGEQFLRSRRTASSFGSSPHGRGTARCQEERLPLSRFIPAWAGNSFHDPRRENGRTVHPRMGGEQVTTSCPLNVSAGSSPHGRGTVLFQKLETVIRRFIPAWAGNRPVSGRGVHGQPVHPRMGGEQTITVIKQIADAGSSPHGRGTDNAACMGVFSSRFIPAWAGNSLARNPVTIRLPVHPRMGGEQTSCNVL